jgi:Carboxypeptidase regulatory-like domain/TonB dependent receptor
MDGIRNVKRLFVIAVVAGFSVCCLFAQTFGEVTGRVTDPSGAVIPGASITLTNVNTSGVRNVITTEPGTYTFPSIPPGVYRLRTELPGFKTAVSEPFEVQVQQVVRLDVVLQLGQVSDTVEVAATAELLQSETASVGTVIENKIITELPLNGRQYLGLVALSPNVNTLSPAAGQAGSRQGGDRANQAISTGGQRIMFDYYTLDGVNNTDPNFNTYIVLPSIDAIQEFKVQIGVYPAEFGHQSTQINVLTKSGGNAYHGSLFEFLRNDVLDAQPYAFTSVHPKKSPFKWNDYGFELDGPVRLPKLYNGQDKLFFMANYEALRRRQNFLSTYSVPTPAMFEGDFSALSTTIYDPVTKLPFQDNKIPKERLDPNSLKLLKYYNSANGPGTTNPLTNNYTQFNSSPLNRDGFVLRLDYNESPKSQWMGRYSWGDENQTTQGLNLTGTKILTNYEQYAGSNTRTFTPRLVNEARFGYSRFYNSIGTLLAFDTDVVSGLGIPGQKSGAPVTWGIPSVTFPGSGFNALGDTTEGPYANDNNTLQLLDKLSWVHGKHTYRFGFEYNRQNYNQVGNQFSRGQFVFQPNATKSPSGAGGYGFAEFLLGNLYQSTIAVAIANAKFQRNVEHVFFDDTWKLTSKLTLSLGLRYELTPPFTDTLGDYFTVALPTIGFAPGAPQSDWPYFVRQGNCTDPYAGLNIRWSDTKAVCGGGLNNNLMETKYKNFAPRIGISYALGDKTVIRTGWGLFYTQDVANSMYFDLSRNIAARVTLTDTGNPRLLWSNAIPGGSGTVAQVPPPYAYVADYDHATSYTMQYLLNIQRQFGPNWVVETGYIGSESHHLYGFQNANQVVPGPTDTLASRKPFPNFGVIQLVADGFNAVYNSGSLKVTRRFSQGLSFTSSYTFSKSIDNSSGIRVQGYDTLFPQNSICLRCERALSSFDTRHRFVLGGTYDLPIGKSKLLNLNNSVANTLLGGWQTSASMTIQSGVPQNITIGGLDNASTTNVYDRPIATLASSGYAANPTPSGWYDPAAFVVAPPGTFGNLGRNTMTTPHFQSIDFALHKKFQMPYNEQHVVQFRVEAFNVLNHPSWGAPNGNILAGAAFQGAPANAAHQGFGVISTTAIPMRQLQMALKYTF